MAEEGGGGAPPSPSSMDIDVEYQHAHSAWRVLRRRRGGGPVWAMACVGVVPRLRACVRGVDLLVQLQTPHSQGRRDVGTYAKIDQHGVGLMQWLACSGENPVPPELVVCASGLAA